MPLSDLLGIRARTASGVEVATPTVRSFFRALVAFEREIHDVRSAIAQSPEGEISPDVAVALFVATRNDKRLAFVLEGLTAPEALDRDSTTREALLSLCALLGPNLRAMDEVLVPIGAPAVEADPTDTSPAVRRLLLVAVKSHVDPMTVLGWPLGLFLDAYREFARTPEGDAAKERDSMLKSLAPEAPRVPIIGGPVYPDDKAA